MLSKIQEQHHDTLSRDIGNCLKGLDFLIAFEIVSDYGSVRVGDGAPHWKINWIRSTATVIDRCEIFSRVYSALRYDSSFFSVSPFREASWKPGSSGLALGSRIVWPRWKSTRGFSSISSSQSTRRVVDSAVPAISLSRIVFPSVAWKSHQRHTIVKPFPSSVHFFFEIERSFQCTSENPHTVPPCPCTVLCDVTMETGWAQSRGDFIRTVRPEVRGGASAKLCGIGFIKGTRVIIPLVRIEAR